MKGVCGLNDFNRKKRAIGVPTLLEDRPENTAGVQAHHRGFGRESAKEGNGRRLGEGQL